MFRLGVIIRKETSFLKFIWTVTVKTTHGHAALKGSQAYHICDLTRRTERPWGRGEWREAGQAHGLQAWGLTSPSLPSQGSLVLMAGKAPPPTGAVDPRPKESSLRRQ